MSAPPLDLPALRWVVDADRKLGLIFTTLFTATVGALLGEVKTLRDDNAVLRTQLKMGLWPEGADAQEDDLERREELIECDMRGKSLDEVRSYHVCAMLNWTSALNQRDADATELARLRRVEAAAQVDKAILRDLLDSLRIPLERAVGGANFLRDAGTLPPNITVEWTTGADVALELLALAGEPPARSGEALAPEDDPRPEEE